MKCCRTESLRDLGFLSRIVMRLLSLQERLPGTFIDLVRKKVPSRTTILDVGCGTGQFLQALTKISHLRAGNIVGLDVNLTSLRIARQRGIYQDVVAADVVNMPFREGSFNIALCVEVIEHLWREDGLRLITNLEKVAMDKIVLTTPNGFTPYLPLEDDDSEQSGLLQHRSGWAKEDFVRMGYSVVGSGLAVVWGQNGLIRKVPPVLRPVLGLLSYLLGPIGTHAPRVSAKIICWKNLDALRT